MTIRSGRLVAILALLTAAGHWSAPSLHSAAQDAEGAVQVQVNVPPDVPLRITHFHFEDAAHGTIGFDYRVENSGTLPLLAFKVEWQTYAGEKATGVPAVNLDDLWPGAPLEPGDFDRFQITNIPDPSAQPATRLVGSVTYAEFGGGVRLGPEADRVFKTLTQARRATVTQYAAWLRTDQESGADALLAALADEQSSARAASDSSQERATMAAASTLLAIARSEGLDAVVTELERVSNLAVPE